jgi:hypothetical protein
MELESALIGVWSADVLYAPGAQSDQLLVFRAHGKGWSEHLNFGAWEADLFEWALTSLGWVVLAGEKHLMPDLNPRVVIESAATFDVHHTAWSVAEEDTPSGQRMMVLRIELPGYSQNVFGLLSADATSRAQPG